MEVNEEQYELIAKELTSEISEEEKKILDFVYSESLELRRINET